MKKCEWCDKQYDELFADRVRMEKNLQYQWDSFRFCCEKCTYLSWQVDISQSNPVLEGPYEMKDQQIMSESKKISGLQALCQHSLKLYKVKTIGLGEFYVCTYDSAKAYDVVLKNLNEKNLGFAKDRELHSVTLLAEAYNDYPNCGTKLFFNAENESEVKS